MNNVIGIKPQYMSQPMLAALYRIPEADRSAVESTLISLALGYVSVPDAYRQLKDILLDNDNEIGYRWERVASKYPELVKFVDEDLTMIDTVSDIEGERCLVMLPWLSLVAPGIREAIVAAGVIAPDDRLSAEHVMAVAGVYAEDTK